MKKYGILLLLLICFINADSVSTSTGGGWGKKQNCSSWKTFLKAIVNPSTEVSGYSYDVSYDNNWARLDVKYQDGTTAEALSCSFKGACSYCSRDCNASGKLTNDKPITAFRVCAQWSVAWKGNYSASASLTDYSIYVPQYYLFFDANGGKVVETSKLVNEGNGYGTLPTPTRTGYTFLGWYTLREGGTQISTSTKMGSSEVTVYAHWEKYKTYSMDLIYDGDNLIKSTDVITQNKNYSLKTKVVCISPKATLTSIGIGKNWQTSTSESCDIIIE